ncbi:hypothetical protein J2792_000573 [Novosphingobium capsulatum]|uniref:Uncharacterized protein n=1 Tax=Novosphingobium capsulatum TaxID=13688 RepID=A0ABU1MHC1_9SPHN|nr:MULTISPECIES: hypothetical protein [Novosphingobium]KPF55526.1 hypothetical protein IP65_05370 [Novosphingobium sp. AAP1]MBB3357770.1 hypothetical protein [Novosphingobium sp. BK256]MBB3373566.1 hypothetical protein [Novosphingobium sp. BK280]MBB3377978.1 hypothetical protein [Novosphingobium sp. BK258]MBB3420237.1 hypothetical protein [Novosphingobium sp. BK267]
MNTTIRAEGRAGAQDFWNDHATIVTRDAAGSVLHGFAVLHSGSFAEMVRMMGRMPEADRNDLVIEKSGDRSYGPAEALELFKRADFPL